MKITHATAVFVFGILVTFNVATASETEVPEPFREFDPDSTYSINYYDVNALFKAAVINVGRSKRTSAAPSQAKTGTRMKARINRSTADEGNRFFYEIFSDSEDNRKLLQDIKRSLEEIPDQAPLKFFSRKEQLAYWLNLYNITLLNEIVGIYPTRSLKKTLTGRKSILSKKLLTVAGVPLSLNDIQYVILKNNYGNDPLLMYGLYQGIIGGPNIRKKAYTGENVYDYLAQNAAEFVNSNRGTYSKNDKTFRVSSLYDRNSEYFDDFQGDLKSHLLRYLQGEEREQLKAAAKIKADINDWTVTDLYGSHKQPGGSLADSPAALLNSMRNTVPNDMGGPPITTTRTAESSMLASNSGALDRFSPDLVIRIKELKAKWTEEAERSSTVTIEDLGQSPEKINE